MLGGRMCFLPVQRDLVMSLTTSADHSEGALDLSAEMLVSFLRRRLGSDLLDLHRDCVVFCATETAALTVMLLSLPLPCQQNCVDLTGTLSLVCSREKAIAFRFTTRLIRSVGHSNLMIRQASRSYQRNSVGAPKSKTADIGRAYIQSCYICVHPWHVRTVQPWRTRTV